MKQLYIVANFKSHKNRSQMEEWMDVFEQRIGKTEIPEEKKTVLVPNLASIMFVSNRLLPSLPPKKNIALGVQDISPFPAGAYTGAISTENLDGFNVQYAIIGHSERRQYFHEDDEMLAKKVEQATAGNISPIYCVQGKETAIPDDVKIVAYEPISAIGSGHPDTPENANDVATFIKEKHPNLSAVLYGGSVMPENVHSFTSQSAIDGVLVGGASLDAEKFVQIILNA